MAKRSEVGPGNVHVTQAPGVMVPLVQGAHVESHQSWQREQLGLSWATRRRRSTAWAGNVWSKRPDLQRLVVTLQVADAWPGEPGATSKARRLAPGSVMGGGATCGEGTRRKAWDLGGQVGKPGPWVGGCHQGGPERAPHLQASWGNQFTNVTLSAKLGVRNCWHPGAGANSAERVPGLDCLKETKLRRAIVRPIRRPQGASFPP